VLFEVERVYR